MKFVSKINKAIITAAIAHDGMTRKVDGKTPYITHPFAVACIVSQYTNDEDVVCAALLHDVLEDVPAEIYSKEQMMVDFGEDVVEMVVGVSEDKDASITKEEEKATWTERKKKYLERLVEDSEGSMLICAADKIHNMQSSVDVYENSLGEKLWEKFNKNKEQGLWFYEQVTEILERKLNNPIISELKMTLERYRQIVNKSR